MLLKCCLCIYAQFELSNGWNALKIDPIQSWKMTSRQIGWIVISSGWICEFSKIALFQIDFCKWRRTTSNGKMKIVPDMKDPMWKQNGEFLKSCVAVGSWSTGDRYKGAEKCSNLGNQFRIWMEKTKGIFERKKEISIENFIWIKFKMKSLVFVAGLLLLTSPFECGERYVPEFIDPNPLEYEILIVWKDYYSDENRRANLRYKWTSWNIDIVLTFIGEANFHPNSVSRAGAKWLCQLMPNKTNNVRLNDPRRSSGDYQAEVCLEKRLAVPDPSKIWNAYRSRYKHISRIEFVK